MKRIYLITMVVILQFNISYGQECRCENEFLFVKNFIENNYAGFSDKVNENTLPNYLELTAQVIERSRNTTKESYCWVLINEWLGFFEDGHIQVRSNFVSADIDSARVYEIAAGTEIIDLPASTPERLHESDTVEGIYFNRDSTYKVAVVKNENEFRDYAAVIVSSETELWNEGQVKFELKRIDKNSYTAIVYYLYHQPYIEKFNFDGISFNNGLWLKAGRELPDEVVNDFVPVDSEIKNDNIFYIRIGTFGKLSKR